MGYSASYSQIPFLVVELPRDIHRPVLLLGGQSVIIDLLGDI